MSLLNLNFDQINKSIARAVVVNSNLPITERNEKKESALTGVIFCNLTVVSKSKDRSWSARTQRVKAKNKIRKKIPAKKKNNFLPTVNNISF